MILSIMPIITKTANAETGYDRGFPSGMKGDGTIRAHGLDVSSWQDSGLDFKNIANAGYTFVILRCGTTRGKDGCFEEYYANAKAAGLNVGCYYYSYATTAAEATNDANDTISYIKGKKFEYPIYFDFEDPSQIDLSDSLSAQICRSYLDVLKDNGYLAGIYSFSWMLSQDWISSSGIKNTYEGWVAHVPTEADNTGITSGLFNEYKDRYSTVYGMHQYSFSTYVNGAGPFDANVCYKDYPSIVKAFGFNGYNQSMLEQAVFDVEVYRDRHEDLKDMTEAQLRMHWIQYGMKEGRASSVILDLKYYVENNPDLKNAFGTDYVAAYEHFINMGYKEHRKSSLIFDGRYYFDNNSDVAEIYKDDYIYHYLDNGMREGRRASETFDVDYYLFTRPDVAATWPNDLVMATRHFASHGIREGKIGYDKTAPTISNVTVSNVSENGYTVTCKVTDDWEISKVAFPFWKASEEKTELTESFIDNYIGSKDGDTYSFTVEVSTPDSYVTHIYATDKGGNTSIYEIDAVNVQNPKITLVESSSYSINEGLLKNVKISTTANELLSQFENESLKILDKAGNEVSGSALIGTGFVINLYQNDEIVDSATVIILGDVDGNAIIDSTDYIRIKTSFISDFGLNDLEKAAADTEENGIINMTDYIRLKFHFLGQYNLFA